MSRIPQPMPTTDCSPPRSKPRSEPVSSDRLEFLRCSEIRFDLGCSHPGTLPELVGISFGRTRFRRRDLNSLCTERAARSASEAHQVEWRAVSGFSELPPQSLRAWREYTPQIRLRTLVDIVKSRFVLQQGFVRVDRTEPTSILENSPISGPH